jgi:hypothetical protein
MRSHDEDVHARARQVIRETGKLDPSVRVLKTEQGPVRRASRNAFVKNPDGTCTLTLGIKLPIFDGGDGTGSMGEYIALNFNSMKELFGMLAGLQERYQIDLSVGVLQDVGDDHDVFQMAQFESDNKAAEHVRQLLPDSQGGDGTEDYDLGLCYLDMGVDTDINQYGLKGYILLTADADGRGFVSPGAVKKYFGFDLQSERSTENICQSLLKKWHVFFVQVKGSSTCTNWWSEQLGRDRIVRVDDGNLLAEVKAGIIYVTETLQPDRDGLEKFLLAGGANKRISDYDIDRIWGWLQSIRTHFGDQAKLPGYNDIPMPGAVFDHYRDPWPIDHRRAKENPSAGGKPAPAASTASATPSEDIDWNKM